MGLVLRGGEPSDCWKLTGDEDPSTPPTISRVLNTVGSRAEWRRAGLPVLFDEEGRARPVQRGGRVYRFEPVEDERAADLPHCAPLLN